MNTCDCDIRDCMCGPVDADMLEIKAARWWALNPDGTARQYKAWLDGEPLRCRVRAVLNRANKIGAGQYYLTEDEAIEAIVGAVQG